MTKKVSYLIALALGVFISVSAHASSKECKCHSKNPAMRRMHEIIGFKNCGNCHGKDENLMESQPSNQKEGHRKKLAKRIQEDQFCMPCHNPDGTIKKESYNQADVMRITSSVYCPKDKLRFTEGVEFCSKCGSELININKLMEESKKNPSNEICRKCHLDTEIQKIEPHKNIDKAGQPNCLACHESHNDCASCHH